MLIEILLILVVGFLIWYKTGTQLPKNTPPGPWRLPVIGSLIQVGLSMKSMPADTLHYISKKYGPITFLQIGDLSQVVVEDLDIIKEISTDEAWMDRLCSKWMSKRSFGKVLGLSLSGGRVWKEMRKFSVRTLRDYGLEKEESMDIKLQDEIAYFTSTLKNAVEKNDGVFCMKKAFSVSVLNVFWSMLAGRRFSHDDVQLTEMIELTDAQFISNPLGLANSPLYLNSAFPFLEKFSWLFSWQGGNLVEENNRILSFFQKILEERRADKRYFDNPRDFIDAFMNQIDSHKGDDPETNLYTDEQFITLTMDLFMAALHTTSNTLEFAILYFIKHPEVQGKVRAEIDSVVGNYRLPSISDRVHMPYTEATILELLRHVSVAPIVIRAATRETTLRGFTIPDKCVAFINLYAMHMSKKTWEDPSIFRPERFLNPALEIINGDKILPFGTGHRVCIGTRLAKTTLFVYITALLQKFIFEEAPSHPLLDNQPISGITLSPKSYHALIKPRLQTNNY